MINFLSKRQKTIGGAAALLGFFTMISQLLGIIKNKLLSVHFGASIDLDIFYTAFKIPDIIFLIIGGMAMGSILIPIFTDKENISIEEKEKFMARFFNSFSLSLIIISLIVFIMLPFLINNIFPIYSGRDYELLLYMSRLFLLSPILMGLANFFISINQRNKIFLSTALTGVLYNISIMFGIIFLTPFFGIKGVGLGIVFGALLYLLIQLPSIIGYGLFKYKFVFLDKKEIFLLLKITFPRSVALAISSLVIIYIYSKVSGLNSHGLITIFSFAYAVFWIPIGLVSASYSQAMFPTISKFYSQGKKDQFNNVIKEIFSRIFFLVIPITFFIFTFSHIIVATLFGSQKFGIIEINSTAISLSLFALLTPFLILLLTISKIFYAMGRTKDVMYVNLFAGFSIWILMSFIINKISLSIFGNTKYMQNFDNLFLMIVAFIVPYIFVSIYMIYAIKKRSINLIIFDKKKIFLQIVISFLAISLTYIIYRFLNLNIYNNSKLTWLYFIFTGLIFFFFIVLFSEIFKENNYLDFKKKIIKQVKK